MKRKHTFPIIVWLALSALFLQTCKRDVQENPYDSIIRPVQNDNPDADDLPVGSFAWLHGKIFRPTCANSGCHDGTFEPEFRTISSAYNSLVNHPVIANDPELTFQHRVVPGNAEASFLHERLTSFVPNTSGMMPLDYEPDSDWPANKAFYIQKITEWINSGAPDMYGNPAPPINTNTPPLVYGIAIFPTGNTTNPYPRQSNSPFGIGAIEVPAGLVDVWLLPYDDNAGINAFESVSIKAGPEVTGFSGITAVPCNLQTPITALAIDNSPNSFYYKATLDLSGYTSGDYVFVRTYMDDGVQPQVTEIPNDSSAYLWYLLFSLIVQ